MKLIFLLFGLWLQWASPSVSAQDLVTQRAWLEDSTGQLQWPQVQSMGTTLYEGVLSKGFGSSVLWIRLRVAGVAPNPGVIQDNLVLRIRPVYLDDIQVFDTAAPQGFVGACARSPR